MEIVNHTSKEEGGVRHMKNADELTNKETEADILNLDEENNHCILISQTSNTS